MFWIFSREKRQAHRTVNLAKRTVARMDKLLRDCGSNQDRDVIESHRSRRLDAIAHLETFMEGRTDPLELQLMHPLTHADHFCKAMKIELEDFMGSSAGFARYVR